VLGAVDNFSGIEINFFTALRVEFYLLFKYFFSTSKYAVSAFVLRALRSLSFFFFCIIYYNVWDFHPTSGMRVSKEDNVLLLSLAVLAARAMDYESQDREFESHMFRDVLIMLLGVAIYALKTFQSCSNYATNFAILCFGYALNTAKLCFPMRLFLL